MLGLGSILGCDVILRGFPAEFDLTFLLVDIRGLIFGFIPLNVALVKQLTSERVGLFLLLRKQQIRMRRDLKVLQRNKRRVGNCNQMWSVREVGTPGLSSPLPPASLWIFPY